MFKIQRIYIPGFRNEHITSSSPSFTQFVIILCFQLCLWMGFFKSPLHISTSQTRVTLTNFYILSPPSTKIEGKKRVNLSSALTFHFWKADLGDMNLVLLCWRAGHVFNCIVFVLSLSYWLWISFLTIDKLKFAAYLLRADEIAHFYRFKRLTGRNEVAISAQDYKFYSPRHKYRRVTSNSVSNIPGLPVSLFLFTPASMTCFI